MGLFDIFSGEGASSVFPALLLGGLQAGGAYLQGQQQDKQLGAAQDRSNAELKLAQDRFAFEKELALKKLAEGSGGNALAAATARAQLEAQRQQMIQQALANAAASALRSGELTSSNLTNVGSLMTRPFIR